MLLFAQLFAIFEISQICLAIIASLSLLFHSFLLLPLCCSVQNLAELLHDGKKVALYLLIFVRQKYAFQFENNFQDSETITEGNTIFVGCRVGHSRRVVYMKIVRCLSDLCGLLQTGWSDNNIRRITASPQRSGTWGGFCL